MFAGWDQAKAQEGCREARAEYTEFVMMREETDSAAWHSLPVCLVRRETQCKCGRTNRISRIVGGNDVEKNEYPWQGNTASSGSPTRDSYYPRFNFQFASPFAPPDPWKCVEDPSLAETRSSQPLTALCLVRL